MGYSIHVYNNKEKEIDFSAFKDKKYYIQVVFSITDETTYEREFSAFKDLDNTIKKIIITNDEIDYATSTVIHLMLKDFQLLKSLDSI